MQPTSNYQAFCTNCFQVVIQKKGGNTTAKIQATFNLRKGLFSSFKLASFRDTDQKDSSRILAMIQENDLIIRDLGYFVLNVFENIIKKKSVFLKSLKIWCNYLITNNKEAPPQYNCNC